MPKQNAQALRPDQPIRGSSFRFRNLRNNIRFYILVSSGLLSLFVAAWLRTKISGDSLYYIRLQQIYGFISLGYWYLALIATPLSTVFGKEGFMKHYLFARRALGVSGAYFASLHMLISLYGQLGGLDGALMTPSKFQQALLFGTIGLASLLLMAATSFDKVITFMTFRRWKWLHRTTYAAGVLVLLHIWIIGTHLTYAWVRWILFGMLALLIVLESWRVTMLIEKKAGESSPEMRRALFAVLAIFFIGALLYLPRVVDSYHDQHDEPTGEHQGAEH